MYEKLSWIEIYRAWLYFWGRILIIGLYISLILNLYYDRKIYV